MKKLLLTAILLGTFTFGCRKCPPSKSFFDIEGLQMNYAFKGEGPGNEVFNPLADSMKFENLRLQIGYTVRFYSYQPTNSFSFIPAVYALECVEDGSGGKKEKLTDIQLVTLSNYDANHVAGASINDIININGLTVAQFLKDQNSYSLDAFGDQIDFQQKPDPTAKQAFKLFFKLDNGESYEVQTHPVTIY